MRKLSDLLFEIQGKPGTKSKIVHHDRIKRYYSKSLPEWIVCKSRSFLEAPGVTQSDKKITVASPELAPTQENANQLPKIGKKRVISSQKNALHKGNLKANQHKGTLPLRRGLRENKQNSLEINQQVMCNLP